MNKLNIVFLLLLISTGLNAGDKYALVIGNGSYDVNPLDNTVNDAMDVSNKFESIGFNVKTLINANREEIETTVISLSQSLPEDSMIVFYYAGHAAQVEGSNYLIPVNENITTESSLKYKGVNLDYIMEEFKSSLSRTNILILDSCRDNPYKDATRSGSTRGLKVISRAPVTNGNVKNSIVIYATADGQVAEDGDGRNSPFTEAFLRHMAKENETIQDVMTYVTKDVVERSGGAQFPQIANYSLEKIYLNETSILQPRGTYTFGSLYITAEEKGLIYFNGNEYELPIDGSSLYFDEVKPGSYNLRYVTERGEENREVIVNNSDEVEVSFYVTEPIVQDSAITDLETEMNIVESKIEDANYELHLLEKQLETHVRNEPLRNEYRSKSTKNFLLSVLSYAGAGVAGYFTYDHYTKYKDADISSDAEKHRDNTMTTLYITGGAAILGLVTSGLSSHNNNKVMEYDSDKEFLLMRINEKKNHIADLKDQKQKIEIKLASYKY